VGVKKKGYRRVRLSRCVRKRKRDLSSLARLSFSFPVSTEFLGYV